MTGQIASTQATLGAMRGELKRLDDFKIMKDACVYLRNQNVDLMKIMSALEIDVSHKMSVLCRHMPDLPNRVENLEK